MHADGVEAKKLDGPIPTQDKCVHFTYIAKEALYIYIKELKQSGPHGSDLKTVGDGASKEIRTMNSLEGPYLC